MYRRPIFISLFAALLLLLAILLFQNSLLKTFIAEISNRTLGLHLNIKDISVGWRKGGLQIRGLVATGPRGFADEPIISADSVYADLSWPSALHRRLCFNRVILVIPQITVVKNASGAVNFEEVGNHLKRHVSDLRQESGSDQGKGSGKVPVLIRTAVLRLGKVTYKDYSGGKPPLVRTFSASVSEIRVASVTWEEVSKVLELLARVGESGSDLQFKSMPGVRRSGNRGEGVPWEAEKRGKESP